MGGVGWLFSAAADLPGTDEQTKQIDVAVKDFFHLCCSSSLQLREEVRVIAAREGLGMLLCP